jgi:hypothetical protein
MDINLHFGQHRNVSVIRSEIGVIDGITVPAHILAHQKASTAAFLTSLPTDTPYLVDPATYRLQNPREKHLNAAGDLRLSTRKLCDAYHPELSALVGADGERSPDRFPSPEALTQGVLEFQQRAVDEGSSAGTAKKYLARYDKLHVKPPRAVVPPYFRFEHPGDPWYRYSLACSQAAVELQAELPLIAVIAAPWTAFREADLGRILHDYRSVPRIILWFDGYDELFVQPRQVSVVRAAIRRFAAQCERVEAHFGGYLLLLSEHDGLSGLGHGILYTQHKSYRISGPGTGGISERYYIPGLRHFRVALPD